MTTILQEIIQEYGQGDKCKIQDEQHVEALLQRLVQDGSSKLQIITDFDYTLTRFHKDGQRCVSCHGILDNSELMPDEYRQKAHAIYEKYVPFETDPKLSIEEKIPLIAEWYTVARKLLAEYKLSQSQLQTMVGKDSRALLRDSSKEVLSFLNEHKVPVLVFSAGEGDLLEEVLRREDAFFPNIKVVSNYMIFDDEGYYVGYKEPMIHIFNKNQTALNDPSYFQELSHRGNALVLGDSLGDVSMDKGLPAPGAILKIGFLNNKIDERINSFMDGFDVVLQDDQSFRFIELIVKKIVTGQ